MIAGRAIQARTGELTTANPVYASQQETAIKAKPIPSITYPLPAWSSLSTNALRAGGVEMIVADMTGSPSTSLRYIYDIKNIYPESSSPGPSVMPNAPWSRHED